MVFWIIGIVLVMLASTGFIVFSLIGQMKARKLVMIENLTTLSQMVEEKKNILKELATTALGYVPTEICQQAETDVVKEEEALRTEKGRLAITQAESEAVDLRLRELEEIEKELENSSIEAGREMEMLRAQERDMEQQNNKIRDQLDSSMIQLDKLLHELSSSQAAVDRLNIAKTELINSQKQLQFYQEQISMLNQRYADLKRAYDALDIEYAQLYEKQSAG
jgi:hypothetical protein